MIRATNILDGFTVLMSIAMVGIVTALTMQSELMTLADTNPTWYIIRASGISAYILFSLSMLWGLALSSKIVKDWSPGALSMLVHATTSWLGIAFTAMHMGLLLFDEYLTYAITDIFIPFTGPYRPLAVGLGTLSFWIMLIIAGSFAVKKHIGHKRWKLLHYTSYAGYIGISAHALTAGTDASNPGFIAMIVLSVIASVMMLGYRFGAKKPTKKPPRAAKKAVTAK